MKRIFVGIPLSKELQEKALSLSFDKEIKDGSAARRIAAKNLHITLVSPWQTDNWESESGKLKKVWFQPFEIRFDSVAGGPDRLYRVVWAKGDASGEIKDLRLKIYEALGQGPESRPFKLHTTLVRFRQYENEDFSGLKVNHKIDWRQTVSSFVLYESYLLPQGSDYEILETFPSKTVFRGASI